QPIDEQFRYDKQGKLKSILYADFFPREGKRPGAWMTSFRDQHRAVGENIIPVISIVCNFTPSLSDKPSLLKFEEVTTLFHEFGHALHGMLSDVTYPSLSGTSVCWDFVELPSQVFENWCYERECLDLFAKHFETGEDIPQQYIDRIKASSTYHEAYATVRQLSFGILDMAYHQLSSDHLGKLEDVEAFEKKAMAKTELLPSVKGVNMSVQFSHIFAGGYAAGYYSYKWAEVLDADAFELFKEKGVFDKATALLFKDHILSQGDTKNPLDLYRQFRGKEPDSRALLKRAGLAD
ncbi:MAG: M3 family metallopeptidase, partial [Cyclobacteriaceae bacterium]